MACCIDDDAANDNPWHVVKNGFAFFIPEERPFSTPCGLAAGERAVAVHRATPVGC
jgi:hypothetical protein